MKYMQQDKQFTDTDGEYISIDYTLFFLLFFVSESFQNRIVF